VNSAGVLLDTGPLVALLSRHDSEHDRAKALFAACEPPLRTCEAVIAEACFLMRTVGPEGPAEVIALGRKRVYEVALSLTDHYTEVETLLRKYRKQRVSLADACLVRCAELHEEPRILTFDSDFGIYRWARNRSFLAL
jgi:predicted nucleic acid-binding protein